MPVQLNDAKTPVKGEAMRQAANKLMEIDLTQELLNSIMREPGENPRASAPVLPACPQCGERYCGDGAQLCTECAPPNTGIHLPPRSGGQVE